MMKIYFVRHGRTKYNKKRFIQGRVNEALKNTGIKQAKDAGQLLKSLNINFDKIVSSPLSRALETAHLIARKTSYRDNIEIIPNLIERDFGNYEMTTIAESFPIIMKDGFTEIGRASCRERV